MNSGNPAFLIILAKNWFHIRIKHEKMVQKNGFACFKGFWKKFKKLNCKKICVKISIFRIYGNFDWS